MLTTLRVLTFITILLLVLSPQAAVKPKWERLYVITEATQRVDGDCRKLKEEIECVVTFKSEGKDQLARMRISEKPIKP